MRIALIGDIHSNLTYLKLSLDEIKNHDIDYLLLTGDLSNVYIYKKYEFEKYVKYKKSIEELFEFINTYKFKYYFVPGNHDDIETLKEYKNNIDKKLITLELKEEKINLLGIGGSGPAKFNWPYEWTDEEINSFVKSAPNVDIILSHAPPYGIGDKNNSGYKCGSKKLLEILPKTKYFLCGHIHEASGIYYHQNNIVINAGAYGYPNPKCRYFIIDTLKNECNKFIINEKEEIIEEIKRIKEYFSIDFEEKNYHKHLADIAQEFETDFKEIVHIAISNNII